MRHKGLWITLGVLTVLGLSFLAGVVSYLASATSAGGSAVSFFGKDRVGVVEVEGPIVDGKATVEDLEDARKDKGIAAVILRIESPGGAVGASQEILEAVWRLAKEKPVVASMGSVGASGGYYIALGATRILANPATVTGSIGVRLEHVVLADLLRWARISHETLKSGKFKDIGTFDRPMTAEERAILESALADIHQQFKETVAQARNLSADAVERLADGRFYTGRQALDLGLVDALGGYAEAVRTAAELGHIEGEPDVVELKHRRPFLRRLLEEGEAGLAGLALRASLHTWLPVMAIPGTFSPRT